MRAFAIGLVTAITGTALLCETLAAQGSLPVISSLSPNAATVGSGAITLTVNGARFGNAGQNVEVRWNGTKRTTTYVSETQLRVSIDSVDLIQAGAKLVTVFLPVGGGALSPAATFTVNNPKPVIAALTPTTKAAGTMNVALTVDGSAFAVGAAVHWNGAPRSTVRVSGTRLTVSLPSADLAVPGNYSVTVVNPAPGGGASAPHSFSVVERPRITAFYIGGPNNPQRVWAGQSVALDVMNAGATPYLWRAAQTSSALQTTAWQRVGGIAFHTFPLWRASDCGLIDPALYRHSETLHFQYAAIVGSDTVLSPSVADSVVVRLPWCSPVSVTPNPIVAWAGYRPSSMERSVCPVGTIMTGVRVRTGKAGLLNNVDVVNAVGAICGSTNAPMVGASEGSITVNTNFGTISAPLVQLAGSSIKETLKLILALPTSLPTGLQDGAFNPLNTRVVDGVPTTLGEDSWTMKCPNGTAPIGMYVYRNANGRAAGLSFLCVRSDT